MALSGYTTRVIRGHDDDDFHIDPGCQEVT